MDDSTQPPGWRRWGGRVALVGGGLLVGGVLAASLTAGAATPTIGDTANSARPSRPGPTIGVVRWTSPRASVPTSTC